MDAIAFKEKLAAAGDDACFAGGVTKYQHVERLGSENVDGLFNGWPIIVQEKIDGANLSVWRSGEQLCISSRNRQLLGPGIAGVGESGSGFRGAVGYIREHAGIHWVLDAHPDWVLRGEWLVKHTIAYEPTAWNHFYVFDVQLKSGGYVSVQDYMSVLDYAGVRMVPLLGIITGESGDGWVVDEGRCYDWAGHLLDKGAMPDTSGITPANGGLIALLTRLAKAPSHLGAPMAEGLVVKRYDFVNKFGRTQWGKVVNESFSDAHKTEQATEKDPAEVRFVARRITPEFIAKTLHQIEDSTGEHFEPRHIGELLGRVWHDAFVEEMWDFVKKEKVGAFDFKTAQQLATRKARDAALAYCGGSQ